MKNTILLLTLMTTMNLTANPFTSMGNTTVQIQQQHSQKYFYAKRAAQRGNAQAQYDLGLMYATGDGVQKNEALALTWFNRAAQNNFAKSVDVNSVVATTRDSQKFRFAKEAADRGNARAQYDLAMMYLKGENVQQNKKLAFNYFHKAARNNIVEAKFQMGLNFSEGRGVRQQNQLARYWFKLAAKAGHPQAMAYLASIEKRVSPHYGQNRRVAFNFYR